MANQYNTPTRLFNFNGLTSEGLVAAWNLEDATDEFSTNDLTNNGGVTFVTGKISKAANFDGVNDNLSIDDNAALSIGAGFTFGCYGWFKLDVLPGAGLLATIFSKWNPAANQEYILQIGETGIIQFAVSSTGADIFSVNSIAGVIQANVWYFFSAWYDKVNIYLELNANPATILTAAAGALIFNGNSKFRLGARHNDTQFLDGLIDAVFLYKHANRVLTLNERIKLYHNGMGRQYVVNTLVTADEVNSELNQLIDLFSGVSLDITPKVVINDTNAVLTVNQLGAGSIAQFYNNGSLKAEIANDGVYKSYIATGTAPFILAAASSGLISNLNVDLLDGLNAVDFLKTTSKLIQVNSVFFQIGDGSESKRLILSGETIIGLYAKAEVAASSDGLTTITLKDSTGLLTFGSFVLPNNTFVKISTNLNQAVSESVIYQFNISFSGSFAAQNITVGAITNRSFI